MKWTVKQTLDEVRNYMACEDWKAADDLLNDLYEEVALELTKVTEDEENCMYCYMEKISDHYYGFDRMWDKKPEEDIFSVFNEGA